MAAFNPETFAASLKKSLPNARISIEHHTDAERQAALDYLHAINAGYNHGPVLGHGALTRLQIEENNERNSV